MVQKMVKEREPGATNIFYLSQKATSSEVKGILEEMPPSSLLIVERGDNTYLVYRTHKGFLLVSLPKEGEIDAESIRNVEGGWKFSYKSGYNTGTPNPSELTIRVKEEEGDFFITITDEAGNKEYAAVKRGKPYYGRMGASTKSSSITVVRYSEESTYFPPTEKGINYLVEAITGIPPVDIK